MMATNVYVIHGLPLIARCDRDATLDSIRRRFSPYAIEADGTQGLADPVEMIIGDQASPARSFGPGRPVYDSPLADVSYHEDVDCLVVNARGLVDMVLDARAGSIHMAVLRDCDEAWAMCAHPLLTLSVLELMKRRARYPLHAGGVVVDGSAILLPGASGAGKSTLTCALLQAGAGFLSDDLVFLQPDAGGVQVLSFADELDVTDTTAAMFPELADLIGSPPPPGRPKHQVRAEDRFGSDTVECARARALVLPTIVTGRAERLREPDAADLLATLAPNVLLTDPATSQRHFEALAELVDTVPAYRLDYGRQRGCGGSHDHRRAA